MTRVAVIGAAGRMGKVLIEAVTEADGVQLGAAVVSPSSSLVGVDAGEVAGVGKNGVLLAGSLVSIIDDFDVLIDFTAPAATVAFSELAAQARAVHVIGTTGLSDDDIAAIDRAARHAVRCDGSNQILQFAAVGRGKTSALG